jgi:hypothetical protein
MDGITWSKLDDSEPPYPSVGMADFRGIYRSGKE